MASYGTRATAPADAADRCVDGARRDDPEGQAFVAVFRETLQKLGWAEGRNIRIDIRWAAEVEFMPGFAKELIALKPDLILANNTPTTAAVLKETNTIPIVFAVVADPVGSGFVASLARPGGNVTGFTLTEPTMMSKWLEFLKQIAPQVSRVAFLFNPATTPYRDIYLNPFKAAAPSLAIQAIPAPVHSASELESVIAVPAVYPFRFFAELGGLLCYGNEQRDQFRLAATYVDRVLRGGKPSELPVQAPVRFELVINLKTAKALGLTVPRGLLDRADEVIE